MKNKVFESYYKKNFTSLRHAEVRLDCCYQSIKQYLIGKHVPTLRTAKRISRKTKGAVPIDSWGYAPVKQGASYEN